MRFLSDLIEDLRCVITAATLVAIRTWQFRRLMRTGINPDDNPF